MTDQTPAGEMGEHVVNTSLLIASLIAIIIIVFVVSIIRYHRRYVQLQKERFLAGINMQENERRRIANDLHDSIGPMLSSVKLNINSIEVKEPADMRIVERAGRHLDEIIKSMRQISYNLLPYTLERKGLIEAIKEFISHVNEAGKLTIDLRSLPTIDMPQEKQVHIFRIIQEIIHNAIKHANAKTLSINITHEQHHVHIIILDDGQGFDVEAVKWSSTGLGLKSIETRIEIMNGRLFLESKPGKGTHYLIKIPV